jgi:hypothetical protein
MRKLRNLVEGERDSGLKPNAIIVVDSEQYGGLKGNTVPVGRRTFYSCSGSRSAWSEMFSTGEPMAGARMPT